MIDDILIVECTRSRDKSNEQKEESSYASIRSLVFSYKNIIKIQNLMGLENLEVLRLDNNLIEKIENLGHLKKLKSLDLSFNCIKVIENIDQLESLSELSIYSNLIHNLSFENFKANKQLKILSLSGNKISDLPEMIRALKFIKNLEVLAIKGNPFTADDEYRNYILANLPQLKYLDYIFIDEAMRSLSDDFKYLIEFNGVVEGKELTKKEEGNDENGEVSQELRKINLIGYDKFLLSGNDDLITLLQIKSAFEESVMKLGESIKNLMDNLKFRIQEIITERNNITSQDQGAFNLKDKENEQEFGNNIQNK